MNSLHRFSRTALPALALWLLFAATAAATGPLPAFDAQYNIRGFGFQIGEFRSTLSNSQDGNYRYETETRTVGFVAHFNSDVIRERSNWMWHNAVIRPLNYTYERTGGKKERTAKLNFNWARGTVENTVDGETWKMPIHDGVLDRLVVQLSMMLDLKAGKNDMEYTFADGGKLKSYRFRIIGKESIETPSGVYDTVKLERVVDDDKRSTMLWCAPKLHYLPVRIDQRERTDNYSMLLDKYSEH
jgi:hypothetical protein